MKSVSHKLKMTFDSNYEYNNIVEQIRALRSDIDNIVDSELKKSPARGARAVIFSRPKLNEIDSYLTIGNGDIFTTLYRILAGLNRVKTEVEAFVRLPSPKPSPKCSPRTNRKHSSGSLSTPKKSPLPKTAKPKRSILAATTTLKGKTTKRVTFAQRGSD